MLILNLVFVEIFSNKTKVFIYPPIKNLLKKTIIHDTAIPIIDSLTKSNELAVPLATS
jgi:hypothetical protein